jgi:hypothetical protein
MQVRIHTDIDFNPRGLHENSGVRQWLDDTLIAIQELTTTSGKYRVVELPARSTTPQEVRKNGRKMRFDALYKAEYWIEHNFSAAVIQVNPEDIAEEIERRKAILAQEQRETMDERTNVRYYPPVEVPWTEKMSWGL